MNKVIVFSLKQRVMVVILLCGLVIAGVISFLKLNIEAYPDPVPPLVDIVTQSSGLSAEEIERYITIPIEVQMAGIPNVTAIRTISLFGLSDVKLQFSYDFTYEQAEQWVINRLAQLPALPGGAQPGISPTSPIGEIYRYRVVGPPGYSVTDLKTIQDWLLERRFKAIDGVIDVNGWGGKNKSYDVSIDLSKLNHFHLTLPQVVQAINNGNGNTGAQTIDIGPQSAVIRGIGQIRTVDDLANTLIAAQSGTPVQLKDVAAVSPGNLPRLGIAGQDQDDDVVQGIVLMRRGAESLPTIKRVEAEVENINHGNILPPGVHLEKIYDRSELIGVTIHTVLHNMVVGIGLIFLVQWIFLGNLRSAIIVALTIPFALFFAIILLVLNGESANLLSVGAIDFGLIVDSTVIMVENIYRHLSETKAERKTGSPAYHMMPTPIGLHGMFATIANAGMEVNQAIFFSAAIIIAGFVPLFTLSGIEGHIFGPMAKTYAYAILGGLIATFTISPALSSFLLTDQLEEKETLPVRMINKIYFPAVQFALKNKAITLASVVVLGVL
ncbi:MAG TPA: efflux RND transporter permease subunit, partial [Pseudomonadales bacterium]|nr:efflux RND transporter permease subunit [Pseudomonadales bacterium]